MDFLMGNVDSAVFGGVQGATGAVVSNGERDSSGSGSASTVLAPSYGNLNRQAMERMDDNTKVMIGTTTSMLEDMQSGERTWSNVVSALKSNSLFETVDGDAIHRSDQMTQAGRFDFKFDGGPDLRAVNEISSWLTQLINDQDIIKTMNVDIQDLAKTVAQTGSRADDNETFFAKDQSQNKDVVDVGAIRYPDLDNPYLKVYRIKVNAWSRSSRVLFHQEDNSGMTGDFNCYQFRPRSDRIASLSNDVRQRAIQTAEALFD